MKRIQLAIGAGMVAALGAIAATVWVGLAVREDTVVAHPYEDGLRQDAERHARAALGLAVTLAGRHEVGAAPLAFVLRDRAGHPVDDAAVDVELSRPETSRGERAARARALGAGRWSADLAFPEPGPWDVRFDVVRGTDRVRLERRVAVAEACDLVSGACARTLDDGREVIVELSPRPVQAMKELAVRVVVRQPTLPGPLPLAPPGGEGSGAGIPRGDGRDTRMPEGDVTRVPPLPQAAPGGEGRGEGVDRRAVTISFAMPGMTMGENRSSLASTSPGTYEGKAVLVRCASGRRDWIADVELARPDGARRTLRFPLTLREDAR